MGHQSGETAPLSPRNDCVAPRGPLPSSACWYGTRAREALETVPLVNPQMLTYRYFLTRVESPPALGPALGRRETHSTTRCAAPLPERTDKRGVEQNNR